MEITLDIRKSVEENAALYFEAAKKSKRKFSGAEKALENSKAKLILLMQENVAKITDEKPKAVRARKWFEKFRWFISSEGMLCIGGRDATTNEIVIKKHTDENDVVFHTEMSGSPFFVIKAYSKEIGKSTLDETAIAVASFSRAWKLGLSHAEVFHLKRSQLSKTPKTGEYLEKGSFIVNGHVKKQIAELKLAVGATADGIMCGPVAAVKKNCKDYITITQGNSKSSDIAERIKKQLGGELDDIIRVLPSGGCKIV